MTPGTVLLQEGTVPDTDARAPRRTCDRNPAGRRATRDRHGGGIRLRRSAAGCAGAPHGPDGRGRRHAGAERGGAADAARGQHGPRARPVHDAGRSGEAGDVEQRAVDERGGGLRAARGRRAAADREGPRASAHPGVRPDFGRRNACARADHTYATGRGRRGTLPRVCSGCALDYRLRRSHAHGCHHRAAGARRRRQHHRIPGDALGTAAELLGLGGKGRVRAAHRQGGPVRSARRNGRSCCASCSKGCSGSTPRPPRAHRRSSSDAPASAAISARGPAARVRRRRCAARRCRTGRSVRPAGHCVELHGRRADGPRTRRRRSLR